MRYFNTLFCFSWPSLSIIFACLLGSACTMRADDVCDVTGGVGEGEISWLAGAVDKGSCSGAATMVIPQGTQWFSFAHNTFGPYYAAQIADPPENPLHVSFNLTVSSPKGTLYNLTASSIVSGYQLVPGFCPSGNGQTCTHLTQNASMLPTLESGSIFVGDQTKNGDLSLQLSLTATWETSAEWLIQMFLWSPTRTAALLDPFPELTDSTGMHLLTESQAETLSRYGRPVQAVSADQATRTILRIPAYRVGQKIAVSVLSDSGNPSTSVSGDGGISSLTSATQPGGSSILVTAVSTSQGPMAFCAYFPPVDFERSSADDSLVSRSISLQAVSADSVDQLSDGSYPTLTDLQISILRPPVALVHGLWGSSFDWLTFSKITADSLGRYYVEWLNYNAPSPNSVTSFTPALSSFSASASGNVPPPNSLGLSFNAPRVLNLLEQVQDNFRYGSNPLGVSAASAQLDVIGHSMGGLLSRAVQGLPDYVGPRSFGVGLIHKLITIGTPHLGTPLASMLLNGNNSCVNGFLALGGKFVVNTAQLQDGTTINGAVLDLEGDGRGVSPSPALAALPRGSKTAPMAVVAGVELSQNLQGLGSTWGIGWVIHNWCTSDTVAIQLTQTAWPNVFGQDSDGIVPLTSQANNLTQYSATSGVVHSAGLVGRKALGFTGPGELDADDGTAAAIPSIVLNLLLQPLQPSTGQFASPQ